MTSEPDAAYVWIWLPGSVDPVVAGRLEARGQVVTFNYGQSYLARDDAMPIYLPELPLRRGIIMPPAGMTLAGCIDDAGPDSWGMRVIMNRLIGSRAADTDPGDFGVLTYLLGSDSDRTGALDFTGSSSEYVARSSSATLAQVLRAAELVDQGLPLDADLQGALLRGSSIGGARPKAHLDDANRKLIAKFSSAGDPYPVVQGEFVAMELARRAGLSVAPVELVSVLNKRALLIERFDRVRSEHGWQRRAVVSALTLLQLHEMQVRYGSYVDLAGIIRQRFTEPKATLRELFARITFNILVGNTDDHPRNHAAFWEGNALTLTPAYDICPQIRSGGEAAQAMLIGEGYRMSQVVGCIAAAATYLLTAAQARKIVDHQIEVIRSDWSAVCDLAELGEVHREYFWQRQFLNAYALEGYA